MQIIYLSAIVSGPGYKTLKALVFTSTRADSGILAPFVSRLSKSELVEVHALATGSHLEAEFGETLEVELSEWGSVTVHRVPMDVVQGGKVPRVIGLSRLQEGACKVIEEVKPTVAIVLGDRAEAVSFSFVCNLMDVPIAHFHGGEVSAGARDEYFRHAITKLSSLHFPTSENAARRIIQMGEMPSRVFYFAPLFLSRVNSAAQKSREMLAKEFGFRWGISTAIVTMHGAEFDRPSSETYLNELLIAFDSLPDLAVVFTGPNIDPESESIRKRITKWVEQNSSRAFFVESFGSANYISMLMNVDLALGNSSSLTLEAPILGTPYALLGDRQLGRSEGGVEGLPANSHRIKESIERLLAEGRQTLSARKKQHPTEQVVQALLEFDYRPKPKVFHDLEL